MDVDIDLTTNFNPLDYFHTAVCASRVQDLELKKHNAGIYFQNIPKDKITGLAAIPYTKAQELGYFKIDFLHLGVLDTFSSKEQIRVLLKKEPDWLLLQSPEHVSKMFHIRKHFELVSRIRPASVQELADCTALIRGSKRPLLDAYIKAKNKEKIRRILYAKPLDGRIYFKRSHSVAYALTIVLQLHLIKAGIL